MLNLRTIDYTIILLEMLVTNTIYITNIMWNVKVMMILGVIKLIHILFCSLKKPKSFVPIGVNNEAFNDKQAKFILHFQFKFSINRNKHQ